MNCFPTNPKKGIEFLYFSNNIYAIFYHIYFQVIEYSRMELITDIALRRSMCHMDFSVIHQFHSTKDAVLFCRNGDWPTDLKPIETSVSLLVTQSPLLRAVMSDAWDKEDSKVTVILPDTSVDMMEKCLEYMKTGQVLHGMSNMNHV